MEQLQSYDSNGFKEMVKHWTTCHSLQANATVNRYDFKKNTLKQQQSKF